VKGFVELYQTFGNSAVLLGLIGIYWWVRRADMARTDERRNLLDKRMEGELGYLRLREGDLEHKLRAYRAEHTAMREDLHDLKLKVEKLIAENERLRTENERLRT